MPIAIVSLVIQVLLIIHVLRTGRDFRWIFLLVFLPGIGALIYFVVEILPELGSSLAARRTLRRLGGIVDPGRGLRRLQLEHDRHPSVETATHLAEALIGEGKHDEAIALCEAARTGVFEDDPTVLLTLAKAYFGKQAFAQCIDSLDLLREKNPSFRSPEGHLLYARALDADGRTERAIEEYESLVTYFPGAEARIRFAQLHERLGNTGTAREMFRQILEDARLAPRHFRRAQRDWLDIARKAIS